MGMCSTSFKPLWLCQLPCFSFCLVFFPCLLLKPCEDNVSSEGPQEKQNLGQTCWNFRWEGVFLQAPWPQPTKRKTCLEQHTSAMGGEKLQAEDAQIWSRWEKCEYSLICELGIRRKRFPNYLIEEKGSSQKITCEKWSGCCILGLFLSERQLATLDISGLNSLL